MPLTACIQMAWKDCDCDEGLQTDGDETELSRFCFSSETTYRQAQRLKTRNHEREKLLQAVDLCFQDRDGVQAAGLRTAVQLQA